MKTQKPRTISKISNRLIYVVLIAIYITVLITTILNIAHAQPSERVESGLIDMSSIDLEMEGNLTLTGKWNFYWNKLLTYDEITSHPIPDKQVNVPGVWTSYKINNKELPGFGYATYHVHVKGADVTERLRIRIDSAATAYSLYINNDLLMKNGTVATSSEGFAAEYKPVSAAFYPPAENFDIIIHVANYVYARGGLWYQINFGRSDMVSNYEHHIIYKDAFLLGSIIVMTLYFFSYFSLLKEYTNAVILSLLSFTIALRIMLYGDYLIYQVLPEINFNVLVRLQYLTIVTGPLLFYLLILRLLPINSKLSSVRPHMIIYSLFCVILIGLLHLDILTSLLVLFESFMIIALILVIAHIIIATKQELTGSAFLLITAFSAVIFAANDIFLQANIYVSTVGELTPVGMLYMIIVMSIITAERYNKMIKSKNIISLDLKKTKKNENQLLSRIDHLTNIISQDESFSEISSKGAQIWFCTINNDLIAQVENLSNYFQSKIVLVKSVQVDQMFQRGKRPELVLWDSDSLGFLEQIANLRRVFTPIELPCLVIYNKACGKLTEDIFRSGANDIIHIPFGIDELIPRVENILRLAKLRRKHFDNELSVLHSQIKPHFIFNSISVIAAHCEKDAATAQKLLYDFSDYLRESFEFNSTDGFRSIRQEIELLESFVSLEKARYGDKLQINYDIQADRSVKIPVFCLQPIVENAIKHGLMSTSSGGQINVRIIQTHNNLHFSIEDNGKGISEEVLNNLFATDVQIKGIALRNIHNRLLQLYGIGLSIESRVNQGTMVKFVVKTFS
jgi:signal transduction histidine kinase